MRTKPIYFVFILLCFLSSSALIAQQDTLFFKNNVFLIGEIKSMDRGLITFETEFSDSDFKIEYDKLTELSSNREFFITLKSGERITSKILHGYSSKNISLVIENDTVNVPLSIITEIRSFDKKFLDRLGAYIDFGVSATKANNFIQYSLRSGVNYTAKTWKLSVNVNSLKSVQDSINDTQRSDGDAGFNYFLPNNWFATTQYDFLTNEEQNLKLRGVFSGGFGKYIIKTNGMYFGLATGIASNNEQYITETFQNKNSREVYYGFELNLYDYGDITLLLYLRGYSGITEKGRFRSDFNFNIKYDLPLDFYIGFGTTINYDNQPSEGASDYDYVMQGTVGWSW